MKKNKKGFTLIEIIVVIVILAVLMAVAVPSVLKYINEADNAKYLTVSRAINEEVNIYIAKQMIDKSDQDFGKTVQQLKADFSYGTSNKIKSIISTKALGGDYIHSIDCEFDGLISKDGKGWSYDKNLKNHTITKISIWFRGSGETGKPAVDITEGTKFVVTLTNEKMYTYIDPSKLYDVIGTKEGPITGYS
ncbi:MAG: prepilin-type N-terminal cleavage/methylation domain-containing protein [Coprobacillus sp.]